MCGIAGFWKRRDRGGVHLGRSGAELGGSSGRGRERSRVTAKSREYSLSSRFVRRARVSDHVGHRWPPLPRELRNGPVRSRPCGHAASAKKRSLVGRLVHARPLHELPKHPYRYAPDVIQDILDRMGHAYLDLFSTLSITAVRRRDKRVTLSYPERTPSGIYKLYESMNLRTPDYYDYLDKVRIFLAKAAKRHAVGALSSERS